MREKGKWGKTKKILIRVNKDDKKIAEKLSRDRGMNTSEFMRTLLHNAEESDYLDLHLKVIEKYKKTFADFKALLNTAKRKRRG